MVIEKVLFQVLPNLVAGAISEAAAMQAGDMMQDFKTAYLLGKNRLINYSVARYFSCGTD